MAAGSDETIKIEQRVAASDVAANRRPPRSAGGGDPYDTLVRLSPAEKQTPFQRHKAEVAAKRRDASHGDAPWKADAWCDDTSKEARERKDHTRDLDFVHVMTAIDAIT